MQTAWHKTGKDHWHRATRFFGTMFLISFAMGVVTGIVQEFQFGMNWSDYSRFVSDVFGTRFNPDTGRAELIDFWALLTNPTALAAFPHAVFSSWITAGTVVAAVSL